MPEVTNGVCTKCGHAVDLPHECSDNKRNLIKGAVKLLYDMILYADPASTAGQKSNALTRIQNKRAWIEANAAELQEFLS